jgi:hypothetical protein
MSATSFTGDWRNAVTQETDVSVLPNCKAIKISKKQ